jgi:hypothetical protein
MASIGSSSGLAEAKAVWDKAQAYCWTDYLPVTVLGMTYTAYGISDKVEGLQLYNGLYYWNAKVRK